MSAPDYKADNDWLRDEMATNMIYNKEANELRTEIERLTTLLAASEALKSGYLAEIERLRGENTALRDLIYDKGSDFDALEPKP